MRSAGYLRQQVGIWAERAAAAATRQRCARLEHRPALPQLAVRTRVGGSVQQADSAAQLVHSLQAGRAVVVAAWKTMKRLEAGRWWGCRRCLHAASRVRASAAPAHEQSRSSGPACIPAPARPHTHLSSSKPAAAAPPPAPKPPMPAPAMPMLAMPPSPLMPPAMPPSAGPLPGACPSAPSRPAQ